jgi:hypothetical protein
MTTNEIIQTVQADPSITSEELNDFELDAIAGGTGMTTQNPLYQHFAEEAKKAGPVVNFKFHMATAVTLMGGKTASLESIFDPSKPLSFDAK